MSTTEFNQLVVVNYDFLRPFAFNLTKDAEDAKDLIQETIFKALANRDKYNWGTNVKAWMFTIMRNIFINDYRKKSKYQIVSDTSDNDFLLNYKPSVNTESGESRVQIKEIQSAIEDLPEIFNVPFRLYFEGYKYHEISEILKEPLGTIKSRIHFARKLLKNKIAQF
ncbi:MAG: RNA polymerase sigma factor [Ginsengibacter sp.]